MPRVFVNLDDTTCDQKGNSKYNVHHASYAMNLVELMITNGASPDDIAIATFYQEQHDLYRAFLRNMQLCHP